MVNKLSISTIINLIYSLYVILVISNCYIIVTLLLYHCYIVILLLYHCIVILFFIA